VIPAMSTLRLSRWMKNSMAHGRPQYGLIQP
jgi:hypothetical protein